jgi:hypothetical protein
MLRFVVLFVVLFSSCEGADPSETVSYAPMPAAPTKVEPKHDDVEFAVATKIRSGAEKDQGVERDWSLVLRNGQSVVLKSGSVEVKELPRGTWLAMLERIRDSYAADLARSEEHLVNRVQFWQDVAAKRQVEIADTATAKKRVAEFGQQLEDLRSTREYQSMKRVVDRFEELTQALTFSRRVEVGDADIEMLQLMFDPFRGEASH